MPPLGLAGQGEQAPGRDELCLPLQLEGLDRLCLGRGPHEPERLLPDQDLARSGGLLEPRGHVDRVSRRQPLLGTGDDLAGVEADTGLDAELGQRLAHLERCPHRTERVVLVQHRHAEHGHDRVPDELLDRAAVRLDDPLHPLEVAGEHCP